jgi:hypothetical protein
MKQYLRHRGNSAEQQALYPGICRACDRDGASVTAHSSDPENVDCLEGAQGQPLGPMVGLGGGNRWLISLNSVLLDSCSHCRIRLETPNLYTPVNLVQMRRPLVVLATNSQQE